MYKKKKVVGRAHGARGLSDVDNNEKEREKRHEQKKAKSSKAAETTQGWTRSGEQETERVHVDIQFSSDQKVEGNGGGEMLVSSSPPPPLRAVPVVVVVVVGPGLLTGRK